MPAFYCFSYVFGELLVLALYRKYQEEGPTFAPRYLELLRAGGSHRRPSCSVRWGSISPTRTSGQVGMQWLGRCWRSCRLS